MEIAWRDEFEERRIRREGRKRNYPDEIVPVGGDGEIKKVKVESGIDGRDKGKRKVDEVDVSVLDLRGVIEAVMEGLGSIPIEHLHMAFNVSTTHHTTTARVLEGFCIL